MVLQGWRCCWHHCKVCVSVSASPSQLLMNVHGAVPDISICLLGQLAFMECILLPRSMLCCTCRYDMTISDSMYGAASRYGQPIELTLHFRVDVCWNLAANHTA